MSHPALILLVRMKSRLPREELMRIARERAPQFRALEGLEQKYYVHDPATGEFGGVYLWKTPADAAEYRESRLRATIAEAYQGEGEPRVEVLEVLMPLRDDAG